MSVGGAFVVFVVLLFLDVVKLHCFCFVSVFIVVAVSPCYIYWLSFVGSIVVASAIVLLFCSCHCRLHRGCCCFFVFCLLGFFLLNLFVVVLLVDYCYFAC